MKVRGTVKVRRSHGSDVGQMLGQMGRNQDFLTSGITGIYRAGTVVVWWLREGSKRSRKEQMPQHSMKDDSTQPTIYQLVHFGTTRPNQKEIKSGF